MRADRDAGGASWDERQRHWSARLGRLRLGAEPLEVQLARYRRATWAITVVALAIGSMFLALFSAFRAPGLGALIEALIVLPVAGGAWLGQWRLERRVSAYLREKAEFEATTREQV